LTRWLTADCLKLTAFLLFDKVIYSKGILKSSVENKTAQQRVKLLKQTACRRQAGFDFV
jgi:hypothetical protein